MTNLIIGLCAGFVSCAALAIMWRTAEALRRRLEKADGEGRDPGHSR
jgi:hypothetical protein